MPALQKNFVLLTFYTVCLKMKLESKWSAFRTSFSCPIWQKCGFVQRFKIYIKLDIFSELNILLKPSANSNIRLPYIIVEIAFYLHYIVFIFNFQENRALWYKKYSESATHLSSKCEQQIIIVPYHGVSSQWAVQTFIRYHYRPIRNIFLFIYENKWQMTIIVNIYIQ